MSARLSASFGASRFDAQATGFDRRAGLPAEAVEAIAAAVVATATPVPGGVLLEIGAGTGEIGVELARAAAMPYVGVDASLSMLARFRSRLHASSASARHGAIVQADADRLWPIGVGRARIVFMSRALHLLELGRVAAELRALRSRARLCGRRRARAARARQPAQYAPPPDEEPARRPRHHRQERRRGRSPVERRARGLRCADAGAALGRELDRGGAARTDHRCMARQTGTRGHRPAARCSGDGARRARSLGARSLRRSRRTARRTRRVRAHR